ncbi:hypothetical protein PF005_g32019 [Phytophthora fragariae]|uniref:Pectate lyase n=1 Tax=Phytophthora fragariae TaxID=53985 RepID=A0A6A3I0D5_9STRA|nr:hypothetical protein PF009_g27033 [Phytophthora fragariae]KAE8973528.1 hypothetical protein PF011_g25215 [Phytophthora fragariae]KAE9071375.1 hypothetical protein PF010_g25897 [Phytophthora fragariae]KAE9072074.1 hypothetical protein PF007_g26311 [Phytophthora fragariae]KAE9087679.1 hypothetical protein PF006_g25752 [Phytophthora fragariae]
MTRLELLTRVLVRFGVTTLASSTTPTAPPWQVYINCVTLDGKAAGTNSTSTKVTKAPLVLPADSSVAGEATQEEDATETPIVTKAPVVPAPAATTAPSTSSSKCLRRRP